MKFTKEYLCTLVEGILIGTTYPFASGDLDVIENYLQTIVAAMSTTLWHLHIVADFSHYGSGFASYVHLYISKRDSSRATVQINNTQRTENVEGLMLYLCRLAPYAVYSKGDWSTTYEDGKKIGGYSHFIEPHEVDSTPSGNWEKEIQAIKELLQIYGYLIPPAEIINQDLDFQIHIPTIIGNHPYKVFDCLFYWED